MRGRVGYAFDRALIYAHGGLAYGDVKSSVGAQADFDGDTFGPYSYSKTTTHVGWTAGAGAEFKIDKNWSFKTEYLYVDLGSQTLLSGSGEGYAYSLKVHPTDNIVRAGLNYTFN